MSGNIFAKENYERLFKSRNQFYETWIEIVQKLYLGKSFLLLIFLTKNII